MVTPLDNTPIEAAGSNNAAYEDLRSKLGTADEQTQSEGGQRLVNIGEQNPDWLGKHVDLIEKALASEFSGVRNKGMRATLLLVNEDPEAAGDLVAPAIEALQTSAAPSAKNELIKALWGIHHNTDTSISAGDEVYAELISTADPFVVDRALEYIGGAVVDEPDSFPETIRSVVEALEKPDKSIITSATVILGVIARDAPESLPDREHIIRTLEKVRDWEMVQPQRETIEKSFRDVRAAEVQREGNNTGD